MTRTAIFAAVLAGLVAVAAVLPVGQPAKLAPRTGPKLSDVKAWGYQLQGARPDFMSPEFDLLVIDNARNVSGHQLYSSGDIDAFRKRPGRSDRIVLAYMSIGEAETYRPYWRPSWLSQVWRLATKPSWLGQENTEWKGNYHVRYWLPGWQGIFVPALASNATNLWDTIWRRLGGDPAAYVDQIIDADFDGVYLDRIDAFQQWKNERPTAEADMAAFVARISAYAKTRRPGFLVVAQNGEELARRSDYLKTIDGLAKEDLMFGADGSERENSKDDITHTTNALTRVKRAGLPVFTVEYVSDPAGQQRAARHARTNGFVPSFAGRDLNLAPLLPPAVHSDVAAPAPKR